MRHLVAAINAAILSDGTICTDPTSKQEQVTVSFVKIRSTDNRFCVAVAE